MKSKDRHSGIAGAQGLAKESAADRALPVLKGVAHSFVDLPGLRMHVAEAGSGLPLLLLHGFPSTGGSGARSFPSWPGSSG
jgi:hypothetical protein